VSGSDTEIVLAPEERERILVVDDEQLMREMMVDMIGELGVDVESATGVAQAKVIIEAKRIDLIVSDMRMPVANGVDLLEWCRAVGRNTPFMLVSGFSDAELIIKALNLGARSFLSKPFSGETLIRAVEDALATRRLERTRAQLMDHLENSNRLLESRVRERTRELQLAQDVTIIALAGLAETRDPETGQHIERTRSYVRALAQHLQRHGPASHVMDDVAIDLLYRTAPLHDIGKVGVPDAILLKPARLTPEEFEVMKKHTIYGGDALDRAAKQLGTSSFLHFARDIAYQHHERWDGGGYPFRLAGESIVLAARFMALADAYDALVSRRVYKGPMSHAEAREVIRQDRATHFDPVIVDAFFTVEKQFQDIAGTYVD
jgi:putative two-component system response regulator